LRVNLQDWGATCAVVTQALGERWGAWFPEVFDRVLLDAPCSGQSLRSAERRKSRPVTHRELEALQAQQIRLLVSGFQALRPGGELVYATCSLHPDENEAVLDALLAHYPGAAEIAPISLLRAPTLLSFQGRHYDPAVGNALRLWPHLYDTAGFFAALVHKIDTVPVRREPHPVRPLSEAGYLPLRPREESDLCRQLLETHGFDLEGVLRHHRLALWKRGPKVHALPALYLEQFPDLPVISAGILIGEWKGPAWVPSHELVCRFWSRFAAGRVTLSVEAGQRWLRGEELRDLPAGVAGPGGVVLVQDETGRPLGRGKLSGRRLRNLLPRRLVY
jgi:16S rRNA (cytosine1407-C5)-methyltransferase